MLQTLLVPLCLPTPLRARPPQSTSMEPQQEALQPPAAERMQTDGLQPGIQDPAKPFTLCVVLRMACMSPTREIERWWCLRHDSSWAPFAAAAAAGLCRQTVL